MFPSGHTFVYWPHLGCSVLNSLSHNGSDVKRFSLHLASCLRILPVQLILCQGRVWGKDSAAPFRWGPRRTSRAFERLFSLMEPSLCHIRVNRHFQSNFFAPTVCGHQFDDDPIRPRQSSTAIIKLPLIKRRRWLTASLSHYHLLYSISLLGY